MADTDKHDEESMWLLSFTKRSSVGKWLIYIVASCLVLAASVYFFETRRSVKGVAGNYFKTNYSQLSADNANNTVANGITAYNNKEYDKAVQIFASVENQDPSNHNIKEYLALSYLQQKEYDKALQQFDALSNTSLNNAGDFLKAITLLERNKAGDEQAAKILLQKVVSEKEEGNAEAAELLKKF